MYPSDHELMQRCADGDAAAFEELLRRWQKPIARVLERLTGSWSGQAFRSNGAEVEDLCQEVFLRVFGACARYRAQGAFSTWLYRIALNVARDAARRRRLCIRKPLDNHQPIAPVPSPEDSAQRGELAQRVEQALHALPAQLREALVLRHFGELTFSEIAELTGIPASTVKSRVTIALKKLRAEASQRGIHEEELEP